MTRSQMLYELRLLLDEANAGSWTNDDCYVALTTGQMEVTNLLVQEYRKMLEKSPNAEVSSMLSALYTSKVGKAPVNGFVPLTEIIIYAISANYGAEQSTKYPCIIQYIRGQKYFDEQNVFLAPVAEEPTCDVSSVYLSDGTVSAGTGLQFKPVPASTTFGDYEIYFIKKPKDITSAIDSESHESAHRAIVHRAFVECLQKMERSTAEAYGVFTNILGGVL